MADVLRRWIRVLTFRATTPDYRQLGRQDLAVGLFARYLELVEIEGYGLYYLEAAT